MKISIKIKLFLFISLLIIIFISISILFNLFFLKSYYIFKNKSNLYKYANRLNKNKDLTSLESTLDEFRQLYNLHSVIIEDNQIIYESNSDIVNRPAPGREFDGGPHHMRDFEGEPPHHQPPDKHREDGRGTNDARHFGMLIKRYEKKLSENTHVFDISFSPVLHADMLHIIYPLDNYIIIIDRTLSQIEENVDTSNQFTLILIPFLLLIGAFLTYLFSKRISSPILQLSSLAKKMADLDFENKYRVTTNDELGELGNSINSLSEQLSDAITSLKQNNRQLEDEIRKERQIEKMRKQFIGNVSHELKTPIAIIQGYAEGLIDNIVDSEEKRNEYCNIILDESTKMDTLVKGLLEISQYESGLFKLNIRSFNLIDLINKVLLKFNNKLITENIEVIKPTEHEIIVKADVSRIEQVLTNYISNAIDHIDTNKILKIFLIIKKHKVRIHVFNSGSPIPADFIIKVWDSFSKLDRARNRSYGGTGLGLAIVRSIMKLHEENYGVNNSETGVTFWIELAKD